MNLIFKLTCLVILAFWVWGTYVQHADGAIHIFLGVGLYGSLLCLLSERAAAARAQRRIDTDLLLAATNASSTKSPKEVSAKTGATQPKMAPAMQAQYPSAVSPALSHAHTVSTSAPQTQAIILRQRASAVATAMPAYHGPESATMGTLCTGPDASHKPDQVSWITVVQPDEDDDCALASVEADADNETAVYKIGRSCFLGLWDFQITFTAACSRPFAACKRTSSIGRSKQRLLHVVQAICQKKCTMRQRLLAVKLHGYRMMVQPTQQRHLR